MPDGAEKPLVLVAEDDPVHRRLLEKRLGTQGYPTRSVADGDAALAALLEPDGPRLAILDWMMPGPDGIDVVRRIREAQGDGPYRYVILVTAKDTPRDLVAGLDAGADDYLVKPAGPAELVARLRCGERILKLEEELRSAREALEREATEDPLTGLLNRRGIRPLLEHLLSARGRTSHPFSVVMVDLDHFKAINDTYGHHAGDLVLQEVALRMRRGLRGEDRVARWGGEEFLIVLPLAGEAGALVVAERLRASIEKRPFPAGDGHELRVTASFGVATAAPAYPVMIETLIDCADDALYTAKRTGRNRACNAVAVTPGVLVSILPGSSGVSDESMPLDSAPLPEGPALRRDAPGQD